ncbi:Cytochrome b245, heavy chain [Corchorus olitorius]|uniref:Cytochrome b245, heavy chain n=1 Tax=Corchorus olitorius TaxID=93759 RepID=A0A1R3KQI7_9ROSI|nr:Cytochrome b245, heavy chain [Corchorus olitorius]
MGKASILLVLKVSMISICTGWITLWLLKPTNFWTKKWKAAEASAKDTVFGYSGLDFAVYTFPVIALAMIGLVYLNFQRWEQKSRQIIRSPVAVFSNPVVISHVIGILSSLEILAVFFFILFLAWTFYARISQDFKKLKPDESLKLELWQLKYLRVATRFGLLAEACLALLLLPILRGLAVFRIVGIQFEASVRYHIWLGTAMIFFATFHGGSTLLIWGVSHHLQDEITKWQRTGRIYLAGLIALVTVLVMGITSLPQIRRKKFEVFYYMHHLYIIFLVFFLLHAGDRHFYMIFGGIFLFGIDKLLRIIQSRPETCILSARLYPCKAVELFLPKSPGLKYNPTSILFMKINSISKLQWHSFSITSSSSVDNHTMSVIIKCDGGWTSCLYDMIRAQLETDADKMKCIPVAIEGPYGPSSMTFLRYDSLLMVAGGIGITPFLSILHELSSAQSSSRYRLPSRIELIYIVKKPQDIGLLNSISSLLQNHPSQKWHLKLKVFVTQEKQTGATVGEILHYETSQVQTVHFDTKGPIYAIHGPESMLWFAALAGIASIVFLVFLICFNRVFVPSEKKGLHSSKLAVSSKEKSPKEKNPSWIADIIILSSFIISLACSSLLAIILRWRRLRKEIPLVSQKEEKVKELSLMETKSAIEEHEVHFGGRPDLEDVFSKFLNEPGGSNIGVLVCGPETMKERVASLCQQKSKCCKIADQNKKAYLSFHALNFTL